jgi:hypothetical protein
MADSYFLPIFVTILKPGSVSGFYSQSKLGFEIVTGTQSLYSERLMDQFSGMSF